MKPVKLLVFMIFAFPSWAVHPSDQPLFDSEETLIIKLHAPFKSIARDRNKEKIYGGFIETGKIRINIELQSRGNYRLKKETCSNPPLRLHLDKDEVKRTVFHRQSELKMVVMCQNSERYRDYLRREYLSYRLLNEISDRSFKVRWVQVTYIDTEYSSAPKVQGAFFIERKKHLASRNKLKSFKGKRVNLSDLHELSATRMALFQFVIGNADYSFVASPDESCCHNSKLLYSEGGQHFPVPYDFDSSGIVNAPYATPPDGLPIRRVTTRLYRGYCIHNDQLQQARDDLLSLSSNMINLVENDSILTQKRKPVTVKYVQKSFDILGSDSSFQRQIVRKCRS